MGYPIRRCTCGVEHECASLDPVENGKKAARARLPRITDGKVDVAPKAVAPEPAGERRDEVVEMVKQSEVDEGHGGGGEVEEPPIRARHAKPDAVESAQEAQARKFIEQHQKNPK